MISIIYAYSIVQYQQFIGALTVLPKQPMLSSLNNANDLKMDGGRFARTPDAVCLLHRSPSISNFLCLLHLRNSLLWCHNEHKCLYDVRKHTNVDHAAAGKWIV